MFPSLSLLRTLSPNLMMRRYNTLYDRQLNNWLHIYVYKQNYSNEIGKTLRFYYENGSIKNENDFKEVLDDVLSRS